MERDLTIDRVLLALANLAHIGSDQVGRQIIELEGLDVRERTSRLETPNIRLVALPYTKLRDAIIVGNSNIAEAALGECRLWPKCEVRTGSEIVCSSG
ncbi:MAG TPA: hypothetical protein VFH89_02485 [Sphingomicrobium sp.]|nr:hypothetical protein [Sphingomicrobium sp.]